MEKIESQFLPITEEVVKMVYERNKTKLKARASNFHIDPSWFVNEKESTKGFDENFICAICHHVVVDPQECEKCEKVFCA